MATREEIQHKEVQSGAFQQRTEESHDQHMQEVLQDEFLGQQYGVTKNCLLNDRLEHFHVVNGFPPDILHDLLEGIVPFELALCLKALMAKAYFTFLKLNMAIRQFPYSFSDKTNQPQVTRKTLAYQIGHFFDFYLF